MAEPFLGQIQMFGFNFAPVGWAMCNGQLLSIAQNTALFSLLGTTYGGDGQVTFALPNLQSRFPVHFGQGTGLSPYDLGEAAGSESVTLTINQMPQHNHAITVNASTGAKLNTTPAGNNLGGANIYTNAALDSVMDPAMATASISGGNQPTDILPPYLAINWCICLEGIFPSRN
jgi:microcystin-dependent protein